MTLAAGTRLGRYEVLAPLGAGGMGEVYRARDPQLGREVAVKILPGRFANDPQSRSRFEREARAVAALSHPNIVAIFDVGSEQGLDYLVTELLDGQTLRARLKGGLSWQTAVEIGAAIAEGLSAAHAKGITHRDLKPENVFLTAGGAVKILDFGLARWKPASVAEQEASPTETRPGVVMGTVGYMSPEQVRGEAADPPSDIFSLGCVLYEMVTGRRAFAMPTLVQTMTAILESEPPPMSESVKGLPAELERLVARCLEKRPAARMQSARDLANALTDLPSQGQQDSRPFAVPFSRRAGAVATAIAVLAAFQYFHSGKATDSIAVLPFVNASGNPEMEYLSDGITEGLINTLSLAPGLAVMSRNSVFRYKGHETDAQAAGRKLAVQAVLTGRVVQRGDTLSISAELIDVGSNRHLWGERYSRKMADLLSLQEEISTEISEKLKIKLSGADKMRLTRRYTQDGEAYELYLRGRYYFNKRTPDSFDKGIEYYEKAIATDPRYAPAYAALAEAHNNLANYNFGALSPQEAWARARAAADKALEIDETLAAGHSAVAVATYQFAWDWPSAEREFKRALALDPASSTTYHWYAHYLMSVGRTEESLEAGRRALKLDPLDLAINAHQGWHYIQTREYDRALEPLRRTIEMEPNFPVAQWYLGLVYEQQGAMPQAIAQFETAIRLTRGSPSMVALLGHAQAAAHRNDEARATIRQLAELSRERYVAPYPIATIHAALGETDAALARLEQAYAERDSWMDYLKVDPRLDGLRADPRFVDLMQRMNFEGSALPPPRKNLIQ